MPSEKTKLAPQFYTLAILNGLSLDYKSGDYGPDGTRKGSFGNTNPQRNVSRDNGSPYSNIYGTTGPHSRKGSGQKRDEVTQRLFLEDQIGIRLIQKNTEQIRYTAMRL